jgi:hypothetical protein
MIRKRINGTAEITQLERPIIGRQQSSVSHPQQPDSLFPVFRLNQPTLWKPYRYELSATFNFHL